MKASDIGIAMGRYALSFHQRLGKCGISCYELYSGTEVAKEAGALSKHLFSFIIISLFISISNQLRSSY
jgi:magnesium-transporting ATPase (P-type)